MTWMSNGCLIIGGTGSLGRKLIERFLPFRDVAVYSRDEAKHWTIRNELLNDQTLHARLKPQGPSSPRAVGALQFFVGDIRDRMRLKDVIRQYRPSTIIIAAALKQVDTCELSPNESVMTNLVGTQNVIDVVNELDQKSLAEVLFVSTDKACAPVNVYGMCKSISERIVTSQLRTGLLGVRYLCVRYGNVLESRGSIIPLFKFQAETAESLTVTDPDMTRFVMTLDDSVTLIEHALTHGKNGDIWIPRLPSMRIGDLAELFSERVNKPINIVGLRPGEKMHEDLINLSESIRAVSVKDTHYVLKPAFIPSAGNAFTYSSCDDVMSKEQLSRHLHKLGILDWSLDKFKGRHIEEIVM